MADLYDSMIDAAAAALARRMRAGELDLSVYALPTSPAGPGGIAISAVPMAAPARCVRPCDNGASAFQHWRAVPFSAQREILWRALRRDPILPIS